MTKNKANPFTSLTGGLRRGDESNTYLRLQERGITEEDFREIGKNSILCDEIANLLLEHRIKRETRLFSSPEAQIETLLRINEQVWKDRAITLAAIRELGYPPEGRPSSRHELNCINLLNETGDPILTLIRNWEALAFVHGVDVEIWEGLVLNPSGVRLRAGAVPRPKGLRWATAELGRTFYGKSAEAALRHLQRRGLMSIGQELPAFAAMHPDWARGMNLRTLPFVTAPDIEVNAFTETGFFSSLYLGRTHDEVSMGGMLTLNPHKVSGTGFFHSDSSQTPADDKCDRISKPIGWLEA